MAPTRAQLMWRPSTSTKARGSPSAYWYGLAARLGDAQGPYQASAAALVWHATEREIQQ